MPQFANITAHLYPDPVPPGVGERAPGMAHFKEFNIKPNLNSGVSCEVEKTYLRKIRCGVELNRFLEANPHEIWYRVKVSMKDRTLTLVTSTTAKLDPYRWTIFTDPFEIREVGILNVVFEAICNDKACVPHRVDFQFLITSCDQYVSNHVIYKFFGDRSQPEVAQNGPEPARRGRPVQQDQYGSAWEREAQRPKRYESTPLRSPEVSTHSQAPSQGNGPHPTRMPRGNPQSSHRGTNGHRPDRAPGSTYRNGANSTVTTPERPGPRLPASGSMTTSMDQDCEGPPTPPLPAAGLPALEMMRDQFHVSSQRLLNIPLAQNQSLPMTGDAVSGPSPRDAQFSAQRPTNMANVAHATAASAISVQGAQSVPHGTHPDQNRVGSSNPKATLAASQAHRSQDSVQGAPSKQQPIVQVKAEPKDDDSPLPPPEASTAGSDSFTLTSTSNNIRIDERVGESLQRYMEAPRVKVEVEQEEGQVYTDQNATATNSGASHQEPPPNEQEPLPVVKSENMSPEEHERYIAEQQRQLEELQRAKEVQQRIVEAARQSTSSTAHPPSASPSAATGAFAGASSSPAPPAMRSGNPQPPTRGVLRRSEEARTKKSVAFAERLVHSKQ